MDKNTANNPESRVPDLSFYRLLRFASLCIALISSEALLIWIIYDIVLIVPLLCVMGILSAIFLYLMALYGEKEVRTVTSSPKKPSNDQWE